MFDYGGYVGKILRVNLTTKKIAEEHLTKEHVERFIGGRGLAAKMLFDEVPAKLQPFSPRNKLMFMTGPLTGSPIPGSFRFVLSTKSPATGNYTYSVAGGGFGPALKRSGYDGAIIEGKSQEPTYLFIDNEEAELKDAKWLWGTLIPHAAELIKEAVGQDVKIALIGPAGEKLVKMAAVITDDRRAAGRGGLGAVMGAKKLKAVVVRGRKRQAIVDQAKFLQTLKKVHREIRLLPGPWKEFSQTGTQAGPDKNNTWGILPTRNWQQATFEGATKISYPSLREKFVIRDTGCPGCPVKCTKITLNRNGPYAGALTRGPEFETLYSFGSACGVDSPEAIIMANMLCNNFGLDTMSTGVTIAFAMECYEKGLLNIKDTNGVELNFGNHEAMIKMIKEIAYREGKLGQLLAEGSREASRRIGKGSEKYAMQVKGLELGGYDPRGSRGMALVYACGPRGGCHHAYGTTSYAEIPLGIALQPKGKGKLVQQTARARILFDSSQICAFLSSDIPLPSLAAFISAVTGASTTVDNLEEIADRIATVERAFNAREGMTRKDDTLPVRLMTEPIPSGPNSGQMVTLEELELMKDEFYAVMKWNSSTGTPTNARLQA